MTRFDPDDHRRDTAGKFAPMDATRDDAGQVVDLMAALKASVEAAKQRRLERETSTDCTENCGREAEPDSTMCDECSSDVLCRECGERNDDGEGSDGMCGNCADRNTCPDCSESSEDSERKDRRCSDCGRGVPDEE